MPGVPMVAKAQLQPIEEALYRLPARAWNAGRIAASARRKHKC